MSEIVVVGSGIVGLYTAFVLAEKGYGPSTSVIASSLPGNDPTERYVSPLAGAHWASRAVLDLGGDLATNLDRQKRTYNFLTTFVKRFGPVCGVRPTQETELWASGPPLEIHELKSSLESFISDLKVMDSGDLGGKAQFGLSYTGFNFNPDVLLYFLMSHLKNQGVSFERRTLASLAEVTTQIPTARVVFNCAGLGVSDLAGVNDSHKNFPVRGQVVLVRAPHITGNIGLAAPNGLPPTYIIPRPYSGGIVVLGGYRDAGNGSMQPRPEDEASIIERCTKLCPKLLAGPLEIVGRHAGLRPYRFGGPRVERENHQNRLTVVHCYGAGGVGYQLGYALALEAVELMPALNKHRL